MEKFIFDEDESERITLSQPPVSFLVTGKPCMGKSTLARALSLTWHCKLVEPHSLLSELLSLAPGKERSDMEGESDEEGGDDSSLDIEMFRMESKIESQRRELAARYQSLLLEGGCIGEDELFQILREHLTSDEAGHYGYVLDGFPCWGSSDWKPIADQINAVLELPLRPDFIIHVKIHNDDAQTEYSHFRVDPTSGMAYSRRFHSPSLYAPKKSRPLVSERPTNPDAGSENSDSEGEGNELSVTGSEEEASPPVFDFSYLNLIASEVPKSSLVFRPEDTRPDQMVSTFRETALAPLDDLLALFGKSRVLEVDGLSSPEQMLQSVMDQLSCFSVQPSMVPQPLFSPEDEADDLDTMDEEEFLSQLCVTATLHPSCRWRVSRWGRFCPVALKAGKMVAGKQKFSVSFADKVYCLSSQRALDAFIRSPRRYLLPPQPMLPCKLAVTGPPLSGVSSLAAQLSEYTEAAVVSPDQLVRGEREGRADTAQEQAIESCLTSLRDQLRGKLTGEERSREEIERQLSELDGSHPDAVKAGSEAREAALASEGPLSGKIYVSAVSQALAGLKAQRLEQGRTVEGGWILDGFPFDSEQWELLSDANILPEHVISLSDESPEGKHLLLRKAGLLGIPDPYQLKPPAPPPPPPDSPKESVGREESIEQILAEKEKADKVPEFELPPELEAFQERRQEYDRCWQKLANTLRGASVPVISVSCQLSTGAMQSECVKQLESVFRYKPSEYPSQDAEEADLDPLDPQLLPVELGILPTEDGDLDEALEERSAVESKPWGDTRRFCPVSLRQSGVLAPGREELALRYRGRLYQFLSQEAKDAFALSPDTFIADTGPLVPPPLRMFLLGARYSGKSTVGSRLGDKLGLFYVSFHEWMQEKVLHKLYKKPPLVDEEDLEAIDVGEEVGETPEVEPKEEEERAKSEMSVDKDLSGEPLDTTEEAIRSNLVDRAPLPEDILEWVRQFWEEEPFKSSGFILEGFPRTHEEAQYLINQGLFPDCITMLEVSDEDVIGRVLPGKLEILKRKQQKERNQYEKKLQRREEILKQKIEKRQEEIREEFSGRKGALIEEHKSRGEEADEEDLQAELDALEEELSEKLQEGREDEETAQSEAEELEQEPLEDAEERMRTSLTEKYDAELDGYKDVQELMSEASVSWFTTSGCKKPRYVQMTIERFLKPFVQLRSGMLTKVVPVDLGLAHLLVQSRWKQLSHFGWWCPVQLHDGNAAPPLNTSAAAIYRAFVFFFSTIKARTRFKDDPHTFLSGAPPGPLAPIQAAVLGPPYSGKTVLSERICKEYGCLRVSAGGAIRRVLKEQHWSALASAVESKLLAGDDLPDEYVVKAVEASLLQPSVVRRGFVLDSFPVTSSMVNLLTKHQILPIKIFELECSKDEIVRRAAKFPRCKESPLPFHDSPEAIKAGAKSYCDNIEAVRSYYSKKHHNFTRVNGESSQWRVWSCVHGELSQNFSQIQSYIEARAQAAPACLNGLCITKEDFEKKLGEFGFYCPVSLVLDGALVDCEGDSVYEFGVEYQSKYYLFAGKKELLLFSSDPGKFLTDEARALLPKDLPRKLTPSQVRSRFPQQMEFNSYCPVSYRESGECYEGLLQGELGHVAEYGGKLYAMHSEEKRELFMRHPTRFHNAKLPAKLPPVKVDLPLHALPMLGFLEQTVSTAVHRALSALCEFKPKFPFLSPAASAQIFLALHLKAFNPLSSEFVRKKYKEKLDKFETQCNLIGYLGEHMRPRRPSPEELPSDFEEKLHTLFSLQTAQAK